MSVQKGDHVRFIWQGKHRCGVINIVEHDGMHEIDVCAHPDIDAFFVA